MSRSSTGWTGEEGTLELRTLGSNGRAMGEGRTSISGLEELEDPLFEGKYSCSSTSPGVSGREDPRERSWKPNSELLLDSPDDVESKNGAGGSDGKGTELVVLLTESGKVFECLGEIILPDILSSEKE